LRIDGAKVVSVTDPYGGILGLTCHLKIVRQLSNLMSRRIFGEGSSFLVSTALSPLTFYTVMFEYIPTETLRTVIRISLTERMDILRSKVRGYAVE
jgi:hypothetical protein